jgi:ATP-dependent DNA ligase
MIRLPKLYKQTATGSIQTWEIWTVENTIYSQSGKLNGKMIDSQDTIPEGKNIGKVNETTPTQQAQTEAHAKWTAKKKKGYVEDLEDAEQGKVSKIIKGGYNPQLAHSFDKREKDIEFPCASQPKLDGIRACYSSDQGNQIWSRTRKELISVPHIIAEILVNGINTHFNALDGELYNHDFKDDFEKITKIVGQKKTPDPDHELVQYHVYDIPSDKPFIERMKDLLKLKKMLPEDSPIKVVPTKICSNKEELLEYSRNCMRVGYEGSMARNLKDDGYEYKRSKHLQKIKIFEDAEFKLVGMEEGKGKLRNHAGSFICIVGKETESLQEDMKAFLTPSKVQPKTYKFFKAKLEGELDKLKYYFETLEEHIGKQVTVRFQGYTVKNKVPRFPVAVRFREDI